MSTAAAKTPKKSMSNRKFASIWLSIIAILAVIVVTANVLLDVFGNWVDSQLGTGTYVTQNHGDAAGWDSEYNTSDYATREDAEAASEQLVTEISAEGVVLLKNNGSLPLSAEGSQITLLGRAAADPVYGGSGSGSVDTSTAIDARTAIEAAGFEINSTVYDELAAFAADEDNARANIVMDQPTQSSYTIGEMPVADYSDEALASFGDYSDAAIVVLGRGGGEGGDLATDLAGWDDNYEEGQHQLELNKDERDLIDLATENFDTVIVVLNASMTMELGLLEQNEGVDSILSIGSPGQSGYTAVGQILAGEVNPSGRTVDIYPADFTQDPTFANFGNYQYSNISGLWADDSRGVDGNGYFVDYEEGIYIGYRYYETAAVEGFIDYDSAVVYPFGYGLSYTTFSQEIVGQELGAVDGEISVDVQVTNTGDVAGKDVVQLYYSAPYTPGGVEKSSVVLGDFAKSSLLEPGASEVVTVTIPVEELASYDYIGEGAYVLDAGDYEIRIQNDSHSLEEGVPAIEYTVAETVVYSGDDKRASDEVAATNQFAEVSAAFESGTLVNLSRADFAGTFPQAPTEAEHVASDEVVAAFQPYDAAAAAAASDAELPTTGAESDLDLIDMRGLDFDDPAWQELLDSLTVEEMSAVILNGAYNTAAIDSIVKQQTTDLDGPAGFSSFLNDLYKGTAFPSAVLIASTWNTELGEAMGIAIGNEALHLGASGWYGPAVNLHRSPFAGRNFEYYSEDPVLSGDFLAAVSTGAGSKGVYTYVKHFAMNDQETNRVNAGVATWANEQAIRELYLKAFEIGFKDATSEIRYIADDEGTVATREHSPMAVMSSFNRIGATWAGGNEGLMTNVLRAEWGFEGIAKTDFNLYEYMYPDQGAAAGNDINLTFAPMKSFADSSSAEAVSNIRTSTHHILFSVANSNAMDGIAPGATLEYEQPFWRNVQLAINIALGLLLVLGVTLVFRRNRKNSAREDEAPAAVVATDEA